jgi:glycosyltransferase involved in cell wall biosynthesis
MNILIFNWKDIHHPQSGGAEQIIHNLAKTLVTNSHKVTFITAKYPNSDDTDLIDGVEIIRVGSGKILHSFEATLYYFKHLRNKYDIIIEQVNTAPYFIGYFSGSEKVFQFYHQLARKIWFYELNFILGSIGYLILEPIALLLQSLISRIKKISIITVSQSSKKDLIRFGFDKKYIHIITEGLDNTPLEKFDKDDFENKEKEFTVLFHSSLRPMKRLEETITAFYEFYKRNNTGKLWVSGGGDGSKYKQLVKQLKIENQVTFFGRTSENQKLDLMKRATLLSSTSIKEGWGLIISEANSMATPAVVYDVDGLRDACLYAGGLVSKTNPKSLSICMENIHDLFANNKEKYISMCQSALEKSRYLTHKQCYIDFEKIIFDKLDT